MLLFVLLVVVSSRVLRSNISRIGNTVFVLGFHDGDRSTEIAMRRKLVADTIASMYKGHSDVTRLLLQLDYHYAGSAKKAKATFC